MRALRLLVLLLLLPAAEAAAQGEICTVLKVTDGDTLTCREQGRVRLLGIDAPEMSQGAIGHRSRATLARLAPPGARMRLESDVQTQDRYRRRLAYLWNGPEMVNLQMVRSGHAVALIYAPNVRHAKRLRGAAAQARSERAGLWRQDAFRCLPQDHRRKRC